MLTGTAIARSRSTQTRVKPVVGEPSPWFAIERENLRVAMAHALEQMPERALRAAVAAWRSWMASGMHAEGLQWLRRALAACSEVSDVHVRALFATAVFEVRLGRMEEAVPLGRSIADIGRHDEDPVTTGRGRTPSLPAQLAGRRVGHHRPAPRHGRTRSSERAAGAGSS